MLFPHGQDVLGSIPEVTSSLEHLLKSFVVKSLIMVPGTKMTKKMQCLN